MKVEGGDVHTVSFMQDDCILTLYFVVERIEVVVGLEEVQRGLIRLTDIRLALGVLLRINWCSGVFNPFARFSSINFLSEHMRNELSLD